MDRGSDLPPLRTVPTQMLIAGNAACARGMVLLCPADGIVRLVLQGCIVRHAVEHGGIPKA
jgi:hypothetical protein